MNFKYLINFVILIGSLVACNALNKTEEQSTDTIDKTELQLVWSDEFNYTGLPDTAKWRNDVGDGCDLPCGCGWGNQELQYYTQQNKNNSRVENGHLIIEAHRQKHQQSAYTSARLLSQADWKYGRIEIRAKLPSGRGSWPAIWMLPQDNIYGGWPASGEIDIMEHVGYEPDSIFGTVHTKAFNHLIGTHKSGRIYKPDAEGTYHVYAIDWTEQRIEFMVDDQVFFTFKNNDNGSEAWPFDQPFHLIMNIAVGGGWGGKHGVDDSIWPQRMEVDYVRVYQ